MDLRFHFVFSDDEMMWMVIVGFQAGRGWVIDLRVPSVFSDDETMWIVIVGPPGWQRMSDGSSLPLCIQ